MTENEKIAALLFPHITMTPADYEAKYPPRQLKEGARVSRFSPSPTGFLHFGNLFSCAAAYRTARCTDGVFYVRVEDTDQKRKVEGAVETMLSALQIYGITPDEGVMGDGSESGAYGPYTQSLRKDITSATANFWWRKGWLTPAFAPRRNWKTCTPGRRTRTLKATGVPTPTVGI